MHQFIIGGHHKLPIAFGDLMMCVYLLVANSSADTFVPFLHQHHGGILFVLRSTAQGQLEHISRLHGQTSDAQQQFNQLFGVPYSRQCTTVANELCTEW